MWLHIVLITAAGLRLSALSVFCGALRHEAEGIEHLG